MDEFTIEEFEKPKVKDVILIEGLPGIGNVGKIAAKHLIQELDAKKFATMHSHTFPPQVLIRKNGTVLTMKNDFYYWKSDRGTNDLIFVIGNTQSATPQGQYDLAELVWGIAESYGIASVYTLGGLGIGRIVDRPKVYGAVTNPELIPKLEKFGVLMKREGIGQIIGVSGLLLGQGMRKGVDGICLMGETSGYYLDPNSAKAVAEVLTRCVGIEIDMKALKKRAKDTEKRMAEAQKMEKRMLEQVGMMQKESTDDDLRYIG